MTIPPEWLYRFLLDTWQHHDSGTYITPYHVAQKVKTVLVIASESYHEELMQAITNALKALQDSNLIRYKYNQIEILSTREILEKVLWSSTSPL